MASTHTPGNPDPGQSQSVQITGLVHYTSRQSGRIQTSRQVVAPGVSPPVTPSSTLASTTKQQQQQQSNRILSPADLIEMVISLSPDDRPRSSAPMTTSAEERRTKLTSARREDSSYSTRAQEAKNFTAVGRRLIETRAAQLHEVLPRVSSTLPIITAQRALMLLSANRFGHLTVAVTPPDSPTSLCGTLHALDLISAFVSFLSASSRVLTQARSAVFEVVSSSRDRLAQLEALQQRVATCEEDLKLFAHSAESTESQIDQAKRELQAARNELADFEEQLDFEERSLQATNDELTATRVAGDVGMYQQLLKLRSPLMPRYVEDTEGILKKLLMLPIQEIFPRLGFTQKERDRQVQPQTGSTPRGRIGSLATLEPRLLDPVPCEADLPVAEMCRIFSVDVEPVVDGLMLPLRTGDININYVSRYGALVSISRGIWPDVHIPAAPAFMFQCGRVVARQEGTPFYDVPTPFVEGLDLDPQGLDNKRRQSSTRTSQSSHHYASAVQPVSKVLADCLVITALETLASQGKMTSQSINASSSTPSTSNAPGIVAVIDRCGKLLFTFTWAHALAILAPSSFLNILGDSPDAKEDDSVILARCSKADRPQELDSRCKASARLLAITLREFYALLNPTTDHRGNEVPMWWAACPFDDLTRLPHTFLKHALTPSICLLDSCSRPVGAALVSLLFQNVVEYSLDETGLELYTRRRSRAMQVQQASSNDPLTASATPTSPQQQEVASPMTTVESLRDVETSLQSDANNRRGSNSALADDDAWEAEMEELRRRSMALYDIRNKLQAVLRVDGEVTKDEGHWSSFETKTSADADDFWEAKDDDDEDLAHALYIAAADEAFANWQDPDDGASDERKSPTLQE